MESAEGIEPIFVTPTSQKIFGLRIGDNITSKNPYKRLTKEELVQDIENRGVVSDFFGVSDKIKNYPEPELLLVYDEETKYKKNFYLCVTVESAEKHFGKKTTRFARLNRKQPVSNPNPLSASNGANLNTSTTTSSHEDLSWNPYGSEEEIKEESVIPSRDLLKLLISRKRKEFGSPYKFSDSDAHDGLIECRQFKNPNFELIRLEKDVAIQASPTTEEISTQTPWFGLVNKWTQSEIVDNETHTDGSDLKNKGTSSQLGNNLELIDFFEKIESDLELALQQNETVDIFKDDFDNLAIEDGLFGSKIENSLKEFQSFTDFEFSNNRIISALDWKPNGSGVVAVAISASPDSISNIDSGNTNVNLNNSNMNNSNSSGLNSTFNNNNSSNSNGNSNITSKFNSPTSVILIWNFVDPIHPEVILEAPADVLCFRYHPKRSNIIVAGCANGQVVYWDLLIAQKKTIVIQRASTSNSNSTPILPSSSGGIVNSNLNTNTNTNLTTYPTNPPITNPNTNSTTIKDKEQINSKTLKDQPKNNQSTASAATNNSSVFQGIPQNSATSSISIENDEDLKRTVTLIPFLISSSIEKGHKKSVLDITWLNGQKIDQHGKFSKNSSSEDTQFITTSLDGQILIWDIDEFLKQNLDSNTKNVPSSTIIRNNSKNTNQVTESEDKEKDVDDSVDHMKNQNNILNSEADMSRSALEDHDLNWKPVFGVIAIHPTTNLPFSCSQIAIVNTVNDNNSVSVSSSLPSLRLFCATQEGVLFSSYWEKLVKSSSLVPNESGGGIELMATQHFGPCVNFIQSPFFNDILISAGDWTINIWKVGVNRPLLTSPCANSYVTVVRFSPTRPSVFFVGKSDGSIDVWDLLDKSHLPVITQNVCSSSVTSIEFLPELSGKDNTDSVQLLAVGDMVGRLHILEVPRNLTHKVLKEKQLTENFFKREELKVFYVENRARMRAKELERVELLEQTQLENESNTSLFNESSEIKKGNSLTIPNGISKGKTGTNRKSSVSISNSNSSNHV